MKHTTVNEIETYPTPRRPGSCIRCGELIVRPDTERHRYRRLHFHCSDGSIAPVSFCETCADTAWTDEEVAKLNAHAQWMWAWAQPDGATPEITSHAPEHPVQTWDDIDALKVAL